MTSDELAQKAILAALSNNWSEAINLNLLLLSQNPKDIDALNRLAHAYLETGQSTEGQKACQKVLSLDHDNSIANKNLDRLVSCPKISKVNHASNGASLISFLEEPGKTKVVPAVKLATPQELSLLTAGDQVQLLPKKHHIDVLGPQNQYLGVLPDDIAHHLLGLIGTGNQYQAFAKSVTPTSLSIFIREISCSQCNRNRPSFPSNSTSRPFRAFAHNSRSDEGVIGTDFGIEEETPPEEEENLE